jgi:hypothetical protein
MSLVLKQKKLLEIVRGSLVKRKREMPANEVRKKENKNAASQKVFGEYKALR